MSIQYSAICNPYYHSIVIGAILHILNYVLLELAGPNIQECQYRDVIGLYVILIMTLDLIIIIMRVSIVIIIVNILIVGFLGISSIFLVKTYAFVSNDLIRLDRHLLGSQITNIGFLCFKFLIFAKYILVPIVLFLLLVTENYFIASGIIFMNVFMIVWVVFLIFTIIGDGKSKEYVNNIFNTCLIAANYFLINYLLFDENFKLRDQNIFHGLIYSIFGFEHLTMNNHELINK